MLFDISQVQILVRDPDILYRDIPFVPIILRALVEVGILNEGFGLLFGLDEFVSGANQEVHLIHSAFKLLGNSRETFIRVHVVCFGELVALQG